MLNTNVPMIYKGCVPYPRSISLSERTCHWRRQVSKTYFDAKIKGRPHHDVKDYKELEGRKYWGINKHKHLIEQGKHVLKIETNVPINLSS